MSSDALTGNPGLTVAMSAFNEAGVIGACIESVRSIADQIVVVDCSSTDETATIARELGAEVHREPNRVMLNNNKNIAMGKARHRWTLLLDPDEAVSPELAEQIAGVVRSCSDDGAAAYRFPRLNHELGVAVRSRNHYPDYQVRLVRTGAARFDCLHIHESMVVDGQTVTLDGDLLHHPPPDLFTYVHKRNLYSEHRALQLHAEGVAFSPGRIAVRPAWAFVRSYLLKGGWRDGTAGFVISVSGAYGTFLQDAKLWQLERSGDKRDPRHATVQVHR